MNTAKKLMLLLRGSSNAAVTPAFSPTDIAGLALWLDASDSTTLFQASNGTTPATADTDPVGYWGDKSANADHAIQATAGNKPLLHTATLNGLNAVLFADSTDVLVSTITAIAQPYTLFAIVRHTTGTAITATGYVVGVGTSLTFSKAANNKWGMYCGANLYGSTLSANTVLIIAEANGASSVINDGTEYTGNAGTGGLTTSLLVGQGSLTDMGEICLYSGLLSASDKSAVAAYLTAKWLP